MTQIGGMPITDLSKKKKSKEPTKNIFAPKGNFRMVLIGPSGCGKTITAYNLIKKYLVWDRLYMYSLHIDDPNDIYEEIHEMCVKMENKMKKKTGDNSFQLHWFGNSIDDMPDAHDYDPSFRNLVLVDDFINERHQEKIVELFTSGRHNNISTIYLSQGYSEIPTLIRKNATHFLFFEPANELEMRSISLAHARDIDFSELRDVFRQAVSKKYNFFMIDNTADTMCMKYRQNFDNLLFPCEE